MLYILQLDLGCGIQLTALHEKQICGVLNVPLYSYIEV